MAFLLCPLRRFQNIFFAAVDLKPIIDEQEVVVDSKPNIAQVEVHVIDMSECSIYNR
jgi:hypothetical protein